LKTTFSELLDAIAVSVPEPRGAFRSINAIIINPGRPLVMLASVAPSDLGSFGFSVPSLSDVLDYVVPDVIEDFVVAAADWVWNDVPDWVARQVEAAFVWIYEQFKDGGLAFYDYCIEKLEQVIEQPDVQIAGLLAIAVAVGSGGVLAAPAAVAFGEYAMARGVANVAVDTYHAAGELGKEQILQRGYATAGAAWRWGVNAAANAFFLDKGVDPETGQQIEIIKTRGAAPGVVNFQVVKLGVMAIAPGAFTGVTVKKSSPRKVWPWVAGITVAAGAAGYGVWRYRKGRR
jgi:hypothetical protein